MKMTPYLLFEGNCAEAMTFYAKCLGDAELTLTKAGESPMKAQFPPEMQDKIINAELRKGDLSLTASDWFLPSRTPKQGNRVCVYISGGSHEELKAIFDGLAEGADPALLDALQEMPFGSYGALTDKYGVRWMFQGDAPKQ